mgnify:CR=1 FL=1
MRGSLRLLLLGKGGDRGKRYNADDDGKDNRLRPCAHRLDRPRNACDLVALASHMEDVSRDAGDIAACLELNPVRTIGDALVAHVEECIFGKVDARFLRRGMSVLECLVRADLKIDGVLGGSRLGVGDDAPGVLGADLHVGNVDAIGRKIVDGGCVLGRA